MTQTTAHWQQFFQVKGEYSMRNLTVFMTIAAATLVVLYLSIRVNDKGETRLPTEVFCAYLLAGGGVYGWGKNQDEKTARAAINATVTPAPITNNTINQPEIANVAAQ